MERRLVVLSGGLGGARVANALRSARLLDRTTFVANVADDLTHLGLYVSPDVDSVLYGAWGRFDFERGWGRLEETRTVSDELRALGHEHWFTLGDRDLALHLRRHELLSAGASRSEAMRTICAEIDLGALVLPASDDPIATNVVVGGQRVDFQTYHVAMGGHTPVEAVDFVGLDAARPSPGVIEAIREAAVILIAPSSPVGSLAPILRLEGLQEVLCERRDQVVMMSPVVVSTAPQTARDQHHWRTRENLLRSIGVAHNPRAIAEHLCHVAATVVADTRDRALIQDWYPVDQRVVLGDTLLAGPDAGDSMQSILTAVSGEWASYSIGSA